MKITMPPDLDEFVDTAALGELLAEVRELPTSPPSMRHRYCTSAMR